LYIPPNFKFLKISLREGFNGSGEGRKGSTYTMEEGGRRERDGYVYYGSEEGYGYHGSEEGW